LLVFGFDIEHFAPIILGTLAVSGNLFYENPGIKFCRACQPFCNLLDNDLCGLLGCVFIALAFSFISAKIFLIFLPILFYLSLIIGQSRAAFGVGTLIGVLLSFLIARDKKEMMSALIILLTLFAITISSSASIVKKQVDNQKKS